MNSKINCDTTPTCQTPLLALALKHILLQKLPIIKSAAESSQMTHILFSNEPPLQSCCHCHSFTCIGSKRNTGVVALLLNGVGLRVSPLLPAVPFSDVYQKKHTRTSRRIPLRSKPSPPRAHLRKNRLLLHQVFKKSDTRSFHSLNIKLARKQFRAAFSYAWMRLQ
ncbi:hypothetical protein KP509_15G010100 [Ceratopteris richardii]|uniref:Uncharacterized protein n=1 Tax=Ceratopteris richardii TaxID=49495 RepID=A0A8T2T4E9_CERRI|nr:hypothetical protein KP509_15G010100 [Ceratopteris richardii]